MTCTPENAYLNAEAPISFDKLHVVVKVKEIELFLGPIYVTA